MKFSIPIGQFSVKLSVLHLKLSDYIEYGLSAFWLGVLNSKQLNDADEYFYSKIGKKYQKDTYNTSGLFSWEKTAIERNFSDLKSLVIIAAGGGREALALLKMDYDVDAYDCNLDLCTYGSNLLREHNFSKEITYLPKNTVPNTIQKYDGIIIGWGAYTHIMGRANRIAFLKKYKSLVEDDSKLMLSYYSLPKKHKSLKYISKIANFFRMIRMAEKVEMGDSLEYNFVHYFTKEQITEELAEAGFEVVYYDDKKFGCIVAKKT